MIEEWADHESPLGMLQRGRGRGLQLALDAPGDDGLVIRCIEQDTRWDRQLEERGWYFARLVTSLQIPLSAIQVDPADPDVPDSAWFATLLALARTGSEEAAQTLHSYVRDFAPDDRVGDVVDLIWDEAGTAGREGLREVALERMSQEVLQDWVHPRKDAPWRAWSDVPAIAAALDAWSLTPPPVAPDLSALEAQELVAAAREWPHSRERVAAISELGRRGDAVLLELAGDPSLRNSYGSMPGLASALAALGPNVLTRARDWVKADDEFLRWLAGRLLASLGEPTDGPALVGLLDAAVDEGDWLATEHMAIGLGRLGETAAIPSLTRAWAETLHSHARADYLRSLVALRADQVLSLYAEAVDDCESEVRGLLP